jgi:G3E family GTPase
MLSDLASPKISNRAPDHSLESRFILVSGPLGSGKTTVLNKLLEMGSERLGTVAVIVNDFGSTNIDSTRIRADKIRSLAHECICCGSWKEFEAALIELNGTVNTVLIEPTGVADPGRLIDIIRRNGLNLRTLGLVDARNLKQNIELGLQDSTTLVSDEILITHCDPNPLSGLKIPASIEKYIKELRPNHPHNPELAGGGQIPLLILDRLLNDRALERGTDSLPQDARYHAPGHSFARLTLNLFEGTRLAQVEAALLDHKGVIERAKGRCTEANFDWVHGKLFSLDDISLDKPLQMILISSDKDLSFRDFLEIGLPPLPGHSTIKQCLSLYPDPVKAVDSANGITPHFEEADVLYARLYPVRNVIAEIPNQTARGDLLSRWRTVLEGYLDYRLRIAEMISSDDPSSTSLTAPYLKRETGLILGWHIVNYPTDINPVMMGKITELGAARLFFTGCNEASRVEDLAAHAKLSEAVVAEIKIMIDLGLRTKEVTKELIMSSLNIAACLPGADWPEEKLQNLLAYCQSC